MRRTNTNGIAENFIKLRFLSLPLQNLFRQCKGVRVAKALMHNVQYPVAKFT